MRGACFQGVPYNRNARITPAHAGSISSTNSSVCSAKDHPRACGEHRTGNFRLYGIKGSPPRMRGASSGIVGNDRANRITPAHAGSINTWSGGQRQHRDHPRACGEHSLGYRKTDARLRITPAHAGSIRPRIAGWRSLRDHPRACGEHEHRFVRRCGRRGSPPRMRGAFTNIQGLTVEMGSPPRMRGALCSRSILRSHNRITPAHAGSIVRGGL